MCTTLLIQLSWPTTTLQHRPDIGHFSTTVWDMHRTLRDARVRVSPTVGTRASGRLLRLVLSTAALL